MGWVIYQRDDCHLCDLALSVLAQAGIPGLDSVFIDDDPTLEARYGSRVPVLVDARGTELDWPFDVAAVRALLDQAGQGVAAEGVSGPALRSNVASSSICS